MRNKLSITFFSLLAFCVLIACRNNANDSRLERIAEIISDNPEEAMTLLDLIDPGSLSQSDRHFYDFLTIKANDKAYVVHTSDSLYVSVLDYYNRHPGNKLYPEVLYYGGRVYSDLGDYPKALKLYQDALIEIGHKNENKILVRNINSQTGDLLERIRLYSQAIPYLEQSIVLTEELGDTINRPYSYFKLGAVYLQLKDYNKAEILLRDAIRYSENLDNSDKAFMKGFLATIFYESGKIDSALYLIRDISKQVLEMDKTFFNLMSAHIYLKSGLNDSAFLYAGKVLKSRNDNYRMGAYKILLSPELRKYIPPDSINPYIENFVKAGETYYNSYDSESVAIQNSLYNYSLYEKKSNQLLSEKLKLSYWLFFALICIFILICIIFLYRKTLSDKKRSLGEALITIKLLNTHLNDSENKLKNPPSIPSSIKEIKESISNEILLLREKLKDQPEWVNPFIHSGTYSHINTLLKQGKIIPEKSPIWLSVKNTISEISPEFENTLRRLSGNRLNSLDYQILYLIRLGFNYAQISKLLGRVKGAMTYRNKRFSSILFNNEIPNSDLKDIIRII